jgi:hypothetical protein
MIDALGRGNFEAAKTGEQAQCELLQPDLRCNAQK